MAKIELTEHFWWAIERKHHFMIPWGYEEDGENPQLLQPIHKHLDALEAAKDYLQNGNSVREVARWLSEFTGKKLSHTGLLKRVEYDNKRFEEYGQSQREASSTTEELQEPPKEKNSQRQAETG